MTQWKWLDIAGRTDAFALLVSRLGGRIGFIATFIALDIALQWLGHQFQEEPGTPTLLWPASGYLFAVFWFAGRSWWLLLGALHILIETFSLQSRGDLLSPLLIGCADVLDSTIGATLATYWIKEPTRIRVLQVALFILAAAISTGVGALVGTAVSTAYLYPNMGYWPQAQLWWVGNWLGTITVAPLIFAWLMSFWKTTPEVRLSSRTELVAFCLLLSLISWYVFTTDPFHVGSVLQLPVMVFAVLVFAAFRLPPRWAITLAALVVMMVGLLAVHQIGAFAVRESFAGMIYVQNFLVTVVAMTFLLSTAITQMRVANRRLQASEYRYRNFVELSSEAVWCLELTEPMPVSLPVEQMRQWFRKHGRITECSLSFKRMDPDDTPDQVKPLRTDSIWMDVYQRYLGEVAQRHFSCSDFHVTASMGGKERTLLASFDGVVEGGKLLRIWGVARDITELQELNAHLHHEQERLRSYARALVTAEDRARRATAVDLHDGIGQSLIGMGMTLEVARGQVAPETRLLLDELKARLREVQERTRVMISDLSPPGLYDLGLEPALQWLATHYRDHEQLNVELDCQIDESRLNLDLRIQAFKLVRELLRNVTKHAGVMAAQVHVRGNTQSLRLEVQDEGRGFHWSPDSASAVRHGFGLWSMMDRVAEFGGRFHVDTAPGKGARFELVLPIRPTSSGAAAQEPDAAHAS
jgi:signal transduction histidine kinase